MAPTWEGYARQDPATPDRAALMDLSPWGSVGLILLFILIGGIFAGTEFALVSLRESQIRQLDARGTRGRRVAAVARDPNRFLSAVQIGVTVAGFFSAAYGASALAPSLAPWLTELGLPAAAAQTVALVVLTLLIAYTSLVFGELVPKRLALQRSTSFALVVAPPLDRFATLMRPVIWVLSHSTNGVVRLLGGDPSARSESLPEEELRDIVIAHEGLPAEERRILTDVFRASDRSLAEVMQPRRQVTFLDAEMTLAGAASRLRDLPYSRYPVIGVDFDDVRGFVHVRDVLQPARGTNPGSQTVGGIAREVLFLPASNPLLASLSLMRRRRAHLVVVVDEYGGTDGIVTMEDVIEELVGDIRDEYDPLEPPRATGTHDAGLTIEDFTAATGVELEDGPYETVAGYVLARLGRLARPGDRVEVGDRSIEVISVKSKRIHLVRLSEPPAQDDPDAVPRSGDTGAADQDRGDTGTANQDRGDTGTANQDQGDTGDHGRDSEQ